MLPITTVETMRKSDAQTILNGVSGKTLMARAGKGIFESHTWCGPVAIVCGSGNNAGDGYVLALELSEASIPCTLFLVSDRFSEDGKYYYDACIARGIPSVPFDEATELSEFSEVVDCIFGTGFSGCAHGVARDAIEAINRSGAYVISADINSGLSGDNGLGEPFVRSDLTVSIGTRKQGHFLGNAKDAIGRLVNIDIGIEVPSENVFLCEREDLCGLIPSRRESSHKGCYGYVAVMGGCKEYSGAVKLASMSAAALRAGGGVGTLAVPSSIEGSVAPYLLESTLMPFPSDETGHMAFDTHLLDRILGSYAALSVGMGWGQGKDHARILSYLLSHGNLSLVIDADGLNTLSKMDLSCLKSTACRVLVTPHLKEFERLWGVSVASVLADPVTHAKRFAKEYGVCVLLKGSTTVVTDGDVTYLVDRGCAGMATAGSGDVLSGVLTGLFGYLPVNAKTVALGAYLAGRAGELAQKSVNPVSMIASDTVAHLAKAVGELL